MFSSATYKLLQQYSLTLEKATLVKFLELVPNEKCARAYEIANMSVVEAKVEGKSKV